MLEFELSLLFFFVGILFDRFGYPRLKAKLKERWLEEDYSKQKKPKTETVSWPLHKECPSCGSKTKHRFDCPENPKNKKVTA